MLSQAHKDKTQTWLGELLCVGLPAWTVKQPNPLESPSPMPRYLGVSYRSAEILPWAAVQLALHVTHCR